MWVINFVYQSTNLFYRATTSFISRLFLSSACRRPPVLVYRLVEQCFWFCLLANHWFFVYAINGALVRDIRDLFFGVNSDYRTSDCGLDGFWHYWPGRQKKACLRSWFTIPDRVLRPLRLSWRKDVMPGRMKYWQNVRQHCLARPSQFIRVHRDKCPRHHGFARQNHELHPT